MHALCVWVCGSFLEVLHAVAACCMAVASGLLPAEHRPCWMTPSACCSHGLGHARHPYTLRNTSTCTPTVIVLSCLLSSVPNAHVQSYTQWMPAGWVGTGRRPRPPCLSCSTRWLFHWFYLVYPSVDREPPNR